MKFLFRLLFKFFFKAQIKGLEHYHEVDKSGEPMLIIANHVSLLDGMLIAAFLPGDTLFMVSGEHTNKWYEKWLLSLVETIEVDFYNPLAAKKVIKKLGKGKHCMMFPEGRITRTGHLMKVYEGTGMIASNAKATILPIYIDGAEKSKFSYLDGTMISTKRQNFPKITLTVLPPHKITCPVDFKGQRKHDFFKNEIYTILRDAKYYAKVRSCSLFKSLAIANQEYDAKAICVEDFNQVQLSRKKIMMGSYVLGRKLHKILGDEKRAGVLLPNVAGMPVTFFSLLAFNHSPAMLNFTAGVGPLQSACQTAQLKTVITSRKFVEVFELQSMIETLESIDIRFVYLEDVKKNISLVNKLHALITKPKQMPGYATDEDDEAVILFTSGSEGVPKGVVLTHKNFNSNIAQIAAMLTLHPEEEIFNALPGFHCFGLTAGTLWPILTGAKVFTYPSPLHYAAIPEIIYHRNSKIVFGTDTFFNGYAKKADSYDFYSLKAMVAGAERLRPETKSLYMDKFNTMIFEGYGTTEATPVVTVNIPQKYKTNTVGQFVPAMEHKIIPVDGIKNGGCLLIKGPNIMKGYLMADNPGEIKPLEDGWYDTGDIVEVDEHGFVTIVGRVKRFAKIAGEMISLTGVESYINKSSPEGHNVVVAVADERRGEKLILITNDEQLNRQSVMQAAKEAGVSELLIPKTIILVEEIPILGTGKTNYPAVQKIADSH